MRSTKYLSIDIETYSDVDLVESGVYKYVSSPNFEILLFAYAFDDDEVQIIDLKSDEELPKEVLIALVNPCVIKTAYNANFEITCIQKHFNIKLDYNQWICTMVWGGFAGFPIGLDAIAKVVGLESQKDARGKNLIKYFTVPCKPTKANGGRTRNLPHHDTGKWSVFKEYCLQDVRVERELRKRLESYHLPTSERYLWAIDKQITDKGVKIDTAFVKRIIEISTIIENENIQKLKELTELENPNSTSQLLGWLKERLPINSLTKESVASTIEKYDREDDALKVLKLRQAISKTSIKKYLAMSRSVLADDTIKGLLQFYGANRTGRWAGRIVQIQNLPQNHIERIEEVRQDFKTESLNFLKAWYGEEKLMSIISQLIRTAFIPSKGNKFIVSDFSAIEARVLAYIASETWRIDVFKGHGKIYEASASKMFNVPIESITKGSELRQKGKIAELALGYGGGIGALKSMGALKMGLKEEELQPLVDAWRKSNPNIVGFWKGTERACKNLLNYNAYWSDKQQIESPSCFIEAGLENSTMYIRLPSGRKLYYREPALITTSFGDTFTYMGVNQVSRKWERLSSFGGKLVENIVQAVSRDILAESIKKLHEKGYYIAFHVHDEIVIDCPMDTDIGEIVGIMESPIGWARGLTLKADAYECEFYKKE